MLTAEAIAIISMWKSPKNSFIFEGGWEVKEGNLEFLSYHVPRSEVIFLVFSRAP